MRIVNPFYYPTAIFLGGATLFVGVRLLSAPSLAVIPLASGLTLGSAMVMAPKETRSLASAEPHIEREIKNALSQAEMVAERATILRQDAAHLLDTSDQLTLLTTIEYACDRAQDLPARIETLSKKISRNNSVILTPQLEEQLKGAKQRLVDSSGLSRQHLEKLIGSLERNLSLAEQGENAQEAQLISLSTWIMDSAGILQQLQNALRTSNLEDINQVQAIENLSQELQDIQQSMDSLLV